jgi:DNA-binding response OmpR family regulator
VNVNPAPSDTVSHPARGRSSIEPRRILVVEDNDDLREGIATLLAADGFVVDQADSLTSARAAITRSPDVVLLDVHLGREHSYELAAEVLAADGAPSVIVMSGATTAVDRLQFEALGISAYLPKPFTVDDLAGTISDVLRVAGPMASARNERCP